MPKLTGHRLYSRFPAVSGVPAKKKAPDRAGAFNIKQIQFLIQEVPDQIMDAITSATTAISLIRMFSEGPEVSLNGSPTVSPTTAAL
jgi:hypothetical protein